MNNALMRPSSVSWDSEPATLAVLALLLGKYRCARMLRRSPWEFAVALAELRAAGLTGPLLRHLRESGYIEYRPEPPAASGHGGSVVLTSSGALRAQERLRAVHDEALSATTERSGRDFAVFRPRWDGLVRELTFGGRLVKRFRRPAPNQEAILTAFEGLGWPERIDDPLPSVPDVCPVVRLRETIKSLNRGQDRPLLRFRVESDGRGVRWRIGD